MTIFDYLILVFLILLLSCLFNPNNKDKADYSELENKNQCSIIDYEIANKLA